MPTPQNERQISDAPSRLRQALLSNKCLPLLSAAPQNAAVTRKLTIT